MSKTIREAAEELGISKTAVRKYFSKDFTKKYVTKTADGLVMVSEEGIAEIQGKLTYRANYKPSKPTETEAQVTTETAETDKRTAPETTETTQQVTAETAKTTETSVDAITSVLIKTLQDELEALNKQLEAKDSQIKELTEANKNLTEANKNLTKAVTGAQALNAGDKQLLIEATSKRSFWSRIFGRKKEPVQTQTDPTEPKDVN